MSATFLVIFRRRNGQYLVGTPRSKLQQLEAELLGGGWERVREELEMKREPMPGGEKAYVLGRAAARREKKKAIRCHFSIHMERARDGLAQRVAAGKLKDRGTIERRLKRTEARYPSVADLYRTRVVETAAGWRAKWQMLAGRWVLE